jgi:RNase P/RNase MRP subunit p30
MPHHNKKAKRSESSEAGGANSACVGDSNVKDTTCHDLMVHLPKDKDVAARLLKVNRVVDQLEYLGYSSVALVHQVYGKPKECDADKIFRPYESSIIDSNKLKRRLRLYRRLNVVIENQSDMACIGSLDEQLKRFDLVSLTPLTEGAFHSACRLPTIDLITLDYTRGGGLPYRIRSSHIQQASERNIGIELIYGPSILHLPHRKSFLQAIRAVEAASIGQSKLQVILSSGGEPDEMILRSPGDMVNVLESVGRMNSLRARNSAKIAPGIVLEEAHRRRIGLSTNSPLASVNIRNLNVSALSDIQGRVLENRSEIKRHGEHASANHNGVTCCSEDDAGDGFIIL